MGLMKVPQFPNWTPTEGELEFATALLKFFTALVVMLLVLLRLVGAI